MADAQAGTLDWLRGGGEMAELIRTIDWSATPLGPIDSWPQSLRTTVSLCLSSNFPINVLWGPQAIQIYNDGYRIVCGDAHPRTMGESYAVSWASAWPVIGEPFERARRGQTSYLENQRMFLNRNGYLEETFFTFSLSPIRDEAGGIAGLFHPVTETTPTMLSERRTRVLRDAASKASHGKTVRAAVDLALRTLAEDRLDLPFVLVYLYEDGAHDEPAEPRLAGHIGLPDAAAAALEARAPSQTWPLAAVLVARRAQLVDGVAARIGAVPCAEYPEPTARALVVPIAAAGSAGGDRPAGFVVAGLSTRLPYDERYESFLEMMTSAIGAAITNARVSEDEQQRLAQLAAIDKAKTAFFSNVSHEFRTPLTLMLGPLEDSLRELTDADDAAKRARQQLIYNNAKRLLKLVNSLLEFSRLEAGRAAAQFRPTALAQRTSQLAAMFESTLERAGLKLVVECAPLPEPVWVDRQMWEKIVLNLLSNAFKFTHAGEIRVSLKAAGDVVELRVSDTGVGIPAPELPRVFERFHRVEGTRGRSYEGSGIGLALIQELVRLHRGSVRVESEVGRGSSFIVTIPRGKGHLPHDGLSDDDAEDAGETSDNAFVLEASSWLPRGLPAGAAVATPSGHAPAATMAAVGPRPRIVVADDNDDMRGYIHSLLAPRFDVTVMTDGQAALDEIRRAPPDLILSDVMMPRLDGFALIRAVRGDRALSAIPIVLLSARAGDESRVDGIAAGADDYLVKPFASQELLAKLQTLLVLGRLREKVQEDRLYSVFAQTSVGICVLQGPEHVFRLANPTYVRTLFVDRDLVGKPVREAVPELAGQGYYELLDRVYATGEPFVGSESPLALRQADGSMRELFVDFVYQPKRSLRGEVDGILVVVNDVTERVRARQNAEQLAAEREEALRVRDEFLAVASHELKTPVTSLKLQVDMARRRLGRDRHEPLPPAKLDAIFEVTSKQVERLRRLVEDLLDVSRIQASRLELDREPTSLRAVVDEVLARQGSDLAAAGISVAADVSNDIVGLWDCSRLEQVVGNLVGNAIKYAAGRPLHGARPRRARLARAGRARLGARHRRAAPVRHLRAVRARRVVA